MAGAETSTTTLTWMVLFMAKFPEVQAKVQAELDAAFGGKGPHEITLNDKKRLPYAEACVHESQRMASIASFALLHTTTTKTKTPKHQLLAVDLSLNGDLPLEAR